MSDKMTFREKVRTVEKMVEIATPDLIDQLRIISKAQEMAAANNQYERSIDILAIAKRRIVRKAGQS
jgi:hypothetical protein